MARFYAQLCTAVFLVVTVGGLLLGNAVPVSQGSGAGNLGSITLHMTWARDAVDALFLLTFIYVGFIAPRHAGRVVLGCAGFVLVALGVVGFVIGDTEQATRTFAGMHFPAVVNIFDTVVGVLGILAALGTIEDDTPHQQESIIRPGTTVGSKR